MANLGVISALVGRGDAVFEDRLNHASLLDGGLLSGARFYRYPHRDWRALDAALAGSKAALRLVVTDGVFSMEGDLAPLPELVRTVRERDAWLMMDDAHGIGVLGANGRGTLEHFGLGASEVPVLVGTLGKALGAFGAFVAGEADFIDYLMQRARTYIYTTALPPAVAEAARASLRIVREEPEWREALQRNIRRFRAGALQSGLPLADSFTPIQPILIGDNRLALAASHALAERGFWVSAIRPPTVPEGTARLRVTLTANHTAEQVDRLLDALAAVLPTSSPGATKSPGAILDSEAGPEGVSPREGANSLDRAAGPQTPAPQTPMSPGDPARNPPVGLRPTQSAPGGLVPEGEGGSSASFSLWEKGVGLRDRASPEDGMSNGE